VKSEDLDLAYSEFCKTMTDLGKERADLFLARFALLSMISIGDLDRVRKLIADASEIDLPVGAGA
jgi:hypothetical protein